ncbi:hypothetical protein Daus18300_012481 [Diaporthe australafricana]|uniref:nitrilase n=1 Tax=Diaporthe australafricana TaxID=127596 RepID=A0ABR3W2J3_9PEZI
MIPFHALALLLSVVAAAPTKSTPNYNNLTVAIVRAEPANWPTPLMNKRWDGVSFNLDATVTKGVGLVEEAARNGANLVVFPELWFPGYPKGIADPVSLAPLLENYIDNSLVLNSTDWQSLVQAAVSNQIYIAPAFSRKENGALYMGQALISPNGTAFVRHKLRSSGGEREIWSDGTMDELQVLETPYGRWGILECWEHFHPSMTFRMQAQAETLHIAAWPYTPDAADATAAYWESLEVNLAAARTYAVNSGAPLVFASVGNARFLDAQGLDLTVVDAATSTQEVPLVYQSFNTTGLTKTVPYTADGEQSWAVLQQMVDGFPSYIPKVSGDFVTRQVHLIQDLLATTQSI